MPERREEPGLMWLVFCVVGMVSSLTFYGLALEYVTIGGKKLHETSFIFVTTFIYTMTGRSAAFASHFPTSVFCLSFSPLLQYTPSVLSVSPSILLP